MLAREDLVTGLNNQPVPLVVEPLASVVRVGGGFLQGGVCRDHLARDQVFPDVEMFERPLRLRSPKFGVRYINFAEAVGFLPNVRHFVPLTPTYGKNRESLPR
jgi:hypothetical protein